MCPIHGCLCTLQTVSVPLGYSKADTAPVKRYVSELLALGKQVRSTAGGDPAHSWGQAVKRSMEHGASTQHRA